VQAVLDEVPVEGRVITMDALHTTRDTTRSIVETHGADHLMTVKANAPEIFGMPGTIDRERDATGTFGEEWVKAHGRIERRRIRTTTADAGNDQPSACRADPRDQARAVEVGLRRGPGAGKGLRDHLGSGGTGNAGAALEWNRGHWTVANRNHRARDVCFGEDACPSRNGHTPINNATCTDIAITVILDRRPDIAGTTRRFALHRDKAIEAILSRDRSACRRNPGKTPEPREAARRAWNEGPEAGLRVRRHPRSARNHRFARIGKRLTAPVETAGQPDRVSGSQKAWESPAYSRMAAFPIGEIALEHAAHPVGGKEAGHDQDQGGKPRRRTRRR